MPLGAYGPKDEISRRTNEPRIGNHPVQLPSLVVLVEDKVRLDDDALAR